MSRRARAVRAGRPAAPSRRGIRAWRASSGRRSSSSDSPSESRASARAAAPGSAAAHYRAAAADREARPRASAALAHPLPAAEVEGRQRLALARRAHEDGRGEDAAARAREALAAWPASREAALLVAEEELQGGRAERARVPAIEEARADEPPWLVPWSRLLCARQADAKGDREAAVILYKQVYAHHCRRPELRAAAADGLRAPFRPETPRAAPSAPARMKRTSIWTAPGAAFLDVPRFSTGPCTG